VVGKMKKYEFDAEMKKHPRLNSGFIEFPYDVEKEFGGKKRVKVKAMFDGFEYRGSLVKMGLDCHWIGITQKIRKVIDKDPGDIVHVVIEEDTEPRTVDVPEDLKTLFIENTDAYDFFLNLSYSHQREYVTRINEAKRSETRGRRIKKTIGMLSAGKKLK